MEFTTEQKLARDELGNIIVSAGAGSGKTAVLSERVLTFVRDRGYSINDFLILTFTRLAAGEMKARIRKKLTKANLPDKDYVDVADITTFDSFCNSLVKRYHSILNLDENFSIIDSSIIMVMKKDQIKKEIEKAFGNHDQRIESFTDKFLFKDTLPLEKIIYNILDKADKSLDKEIFYGTFKDRYYSLTNIENIYKTIAQDAIVQAKILNITMEDKVPNLCFKDGQNALEMATSFIDEVISSKDFDELKDIVSTFKFPIVSGEIKEADQEIKDTFTKWKNELNKKVINPIKKMETREALLETFNLNMPYIDLILDLATKVEKYIYDYKIKYQVFEFDDISKYAIKLVKENEAIRNELKNRYKMIMIDEYQDTSEAQETFINYIQNNNVYCVGDIKQSIYAFRNARCDIFQDKYNLYKNDPSKGKPIELNKNFRSREEVLNNINDIFEGIMSEDYGGANYKKDHIIDYGNKKYRDEIDKRQNNNLEFFTYHTDKKIDQDYEMEVIAQDIIAKMNSKYKVCSMENDDEPAHLRPVEFKDFAIIMDRGTTFEDYVRVFNRYHIPLYMEKDEDIVDNSITLLLSNLIKIIKCIDNGEEITDQDDNYLRSLLSLARSFLFSCNDEEVYNLRRSKNIYEEPLFKKIQDIVMQNKDASCYLKLIKVIEGLNVYSLISRLGNIEKNNSYLEKFLSAFKDMQDLDYSYDDFVDYLEKLNDMDLKFTLSSKGTTLNSVRLINIHKSKGLEFNIVYFPGLNKGFNKKEIEGPTGFSNKFGAYFLNNESRIREAYKADYIKELISERIRLLYVALTRTREKMILLMPIFEDYEPCILEVANSFYDMLYPYMLESFKPNNGFKFIHTSVDNLNKADLIIKNDQVDMKHYNVKSLNLSFKRKENLAHASKEISFDVNKEVLDLGTNLHFIMEVLDFKNPDYSFIKNSRFEKLAKSFLDSDLMKDVNKAKIYKEYEFVDQKNNTNGIIDLYLVYDDVVRIIDYKTSNLEHDEYKDQLKVYKDYLLQKYPGKKIETYLYSLMGTNFKKIEIS